MSRAAESGPFSATTDADAVWQALAQSFVHRQMQDESPLDDQIQIPEDDDKPESDADADTQMTCSECHRSIQTMDSSQVARPEAGHAQLACKDCGEEYRACQPEAHLVWNIGLNYMEDRSKPPVCPSRLPASAMNARRSLSITARIETLNPAAAQKAAGAGNDEPQVADVFYKKSAALPLPAAGDAKVTASSLQAGDPPGLRGHAPSAASDKRTKRRLEKTKSNPDSTGRPKKKRCKNTKESDKTQCSVEGKPDKDEKKRKVKGKKKKTAEPNSDDMEIDSAKEKPKKAKKKKQKKKEKQKVDVSEDAGTVPKPKLTDNATEEEKAHFQMLEEKPAVRDDGKARQAQYHFYAVEQPETYEEWAAKKAVLEKLQLNDDIEYVSTIVPKGKERLGLYVYWRSPQTLCCFLKLAGSTFPADKMNMYVTTVKRFKEHCKRAEACRLEDQKRPEAERRVFTVGEHKIVTKLKENSEKRLKKQEREEIKRQREQENAQNEEAKRQRLVAAANQTKPRSRYQRFTDVVDRGELTDMYQVVRDPRFKTLAAQQPHALEKYMKFATCEPPPVRTLEDRQRLNPECKVWWGPPGTGKTCSGLRWLMDIPEPGKPRESQTDEELRRLAEGKVYIMDANKDSWWQDYNGEKLVLLDEADRNWQLAKLMSILDPGRRSVPIKGGFLPFFGVKIALTANKDPRQWFPNEDVKALIRRLIAKHAVVYCSKPIEGVPTEYKFESRDGDEPPPLAPQPRPQQPQQPQQPQRSGAGAAVVPAPGATLPVLPGAAAGQRAPLPA